jgi:hypothetical protein
MDEPKHHAPLRMSAPRRPHRLPRQACVRSTPHTRRRCAWAVAIGEEDTASAAARQVRACAQAWWYRVWDF